MGTPQTGFAQRWLFGLDCLSEPAVKRRAGECNAHQGHRIIASREPGVVGNVHALHVAGTHVTMQNKFQCRLWLLLDGLDWRLATPHPPWLSHSRRVLSLTLFCIERFVCGGAGHFDQDDYLFSDNPLAVKVQRFLNGDWTTPVVQHFCDGTCCKSDVDAKVNLYGVLLECDISCADDTAEPSMDDWGTCGKAAGKASFGIMCHDLVSQIVEGAIPSYNSIPNVNEEETDEAAIMRAKIRKRLTVAVVGSVM